MVAIFESMVVIAESAVTIFESVVAIVESLVVIVESVVGIINYVRNFQICGYNFESVVVISSLRSFEDLLKSFLSEFFGVFFQRGTMSVSS